MRVFDKSVWIEWMIGTPAGQTFNPAFEAIESCIVPSLVQFELFRWHLRERTREEAERLLAFSMSGIVVPLDSQTAVHAAELSREHRLHASDAIIYATAGFSTQRW